MDRGGTYEQNKSPREVDGDMWFYVGYEDGSGATAIEQPDWYYAKANYIHDAGSNGIFVARGVNKNTTNLIDAYWEFDTSGGATHGQLKTDYKCEQFSIATGYITVHDESTYSESVDLTVPEARLLPNPSTPPNMATEFCQRSAQMSATGSEDSPASDNYSLPYVRTTFYRSGVVVPPNMNVVYCEYKLYNSLIGNGAGFHTAYQSDGSFKHNGYLAYTKIRKPYN
jgi:hypothetical protein